MKKLAVVIVNYNVKHYVEQCLLSLRRALVDIDAEVYVVDNHSRDGSVDFLSSKFNDIKIIRCNHNQGFARANNIAIGQSESEYVLLLNPDTIVGEHTISDTLAFMDAHPKAGGLGVCMLKANGEKAMESRRGLPTPMVAFYKMCGLCARFPNSKRFGRYYMSGLSWKEAAQIDVVSGAFFLARRSALN
ncbi:MAG: glycosyltransferase, partial [Prevotella sp.]|nr:glycosyltransferase [Prevotella sp.]